MPDLVVIVVSYNVRDLLRRCLSELKPRLAGREAEVMVVDNASSDGAVEMVRSEFPEVRVIANSENTGFARANNQAIRATDSRYVLLLNSDAFLGEHALAEMLRVMESDERIAVVGPRMSNGQGERLATAHAFETLPRLAVSALGLQRRLSKAMAARVARYFGRSGAQHLASYEAREPQSVDWVSGACLLVRRSAAEQVGLLDEGFFFYLEDEDWCRRFWQAGFRVGYAPGAQIVHLGAGSTSAPLRFARILRDSRLRYHRRYHPRLYPAFWLLAHLYAVRQCGGRALLPDRAHPGAARPRTQEVGS